jgi:hypothetical protein
MQHPWGRVPELDGLTPDVQRRLWMAAGARYRLIDWITYGIVLALWVAGLIACWQITVRHPPHWVAATFFPSFLILCLASQRLIVLSDVRRHRFNLRKICEQDG